MSLLDGTLKIKLQGDNYELKMDWRAVSKLEDAFNTNIYVIQRRILSAINGKDNLLSKEVAKIIHIGLEAGKYTKLSHEDVIEKVINDGWTVHIVTVFDYVMLSSNKADESTSSEGK